MSYGRRKQGSFAAPAERAPRDAADGLRGDGRPPIAGPSSVRATTSSDHYSRIEAPPLLEDPFIASKDGPGTPRSVLSRQSIRETHAELEGARARLKPVGRPKEPEKNKAKSNETNSTLAELGFMIDDALGERRGGGETPEPPPQFAVNSPSLRSPELTASPQNAKSRKVPRKPFTIYRSSNVPSSSQPRSSPADNPAPLSLSGQLSPSGLSSPQQETFPQYEHKPMQIDNRPGSPVKERAAIFESLSAPQDATPPPRSPPPRAHLHDKHGWHTIPHHNPTEAEEARLHRAQFGQSITEHTLEGTTEVHTTASQSPHLPTGLSPPQSDSLRAPSRGWPSQVRTSSKTGASEPQPWSESISPVRRDAHNPATRPSIVSQRIAQLALAGLEDLSYARSRTASSTPTTDEPGRARVREWRDHNMDGGLTLPYQLPSTQAPVQEETDNMDSITGTIKNTGRSYHHFRGFSSSHERQTPVSKSALEKQALSPPIPRPANMKSSSPVTPVRGRSTIGRSPRGSGYGVEQSFYFSARKSRSLSRGSGRRLTLQINLGTPDRQSMEKVVIKADMDELEEA